MDARRQTVNTGGGTMTPDTTRLHRFAQHCCSTRALTRVIEPLLADMAYECGAARGWRALTCQLRWEIAFVGTLGRTMAFESRGWLGADEGAGGRAVAAAAATCVAVTAALVGVLLLDMAASRPTVAAGFTTTQWVQAIWYLLPQAVVALPISLVAASLWNSRRDRPAARRTLIGMIAVATLGTVALLWVLPDSNQAFRELMYGDRLRPPSRGANELGFVSLLRALGRPAWVGPWNSTPSLRLAFYGRLALVTSPLVFGALAMALSRPYRRGVAMALAAIFTLSYLSYFIWPAALLLRAEQGLLSPFIAAWAPNLVALTILVALKLASVNRRSARAA